MQSEDTWMELHVLYRHGYSTATQSEGLAFVRYLKQVRDRELGGKPFAEGADMHGPLPMGYILLHDQGNDAAKVERNYETAVRVKQAMDAVQQRYATGAGATGYAAAASQGQRLKRGELLPIVGYDESSRMGHGPENIDNSRVRHGNDVAAIFDFYSSQYM